MSCFHVDLMSVCYLGSAPWWRNNLACFTFKQQECLRHLFVLFPNCIC